MVSVSDGTTRIERTMRRTGIVIVAIAVSMTVGLSLLAWLHPYYDATTFTRDPLAEARQLYLDDRPCCYRFMGALSTLGVMLWSATAAVTLVAAFILFVLGAPQIRVIFLSLAGILTLWLSFDDAYMLHESFSPEVFGFSLFNFIPMVALGPLLLAMRRTGIKAHSWVLYLSLANLGMSIFVDILAEGSREMVFVEDVFKLLGISLWCAFFLLISTTYILLTISTERRR